MDSATLSSMLRAVRRRWWLTLLVLLATLATDALVTYQSPRSYLARTSLLIGPSPKVEPGQLVYSVDALGRSMIVGTYANFLSADIVRNAALASIGVPPDQTNTGIEIKSAALADSALVQVTAVARDPVLAASVANAVGRVGETQMSQFYPMYELTVVTAAAPPAVAYRPDVLRNVSLGFLLGLLLAVASACVYDAVASGGSREAG